MAKYAVNQSAVDKAKSLISANQYDLDSEWEDAQPSTDAENDMLDRHDFERYGEWFLAIDTEATKDTKDRYNFPYGDFRRVHRSGLIAAKQRAAQYDHDEIAAAADDLIEFLDDTSTD